MAKKILRYQNGGNIQTNNVQTLGNIKFNSDTARKDKYGNLIVQDISSGKDYGVVRKTDGTGAYEFLTNTNVAPHTSLIAGVSNKDRTANKELQTFLSDKGYKLDKYGIDGIVGDETKAALNRFTQNFRDKGYEVNTLQDVLDIKNNYPKIIADIKAKRANEVSGNPSKIPRSYTATDSPKVDRLDTFESFDPISLVQNYRQRTRDLASVEASIGTIRLEPTKADTVVDYRGFPVQIDYPSIQGEEFIQQRMINMDNKKFVPRNRGEYKDLPSKDMYGTVFNSFSPKGSIQDTVSSSTYIGIGPDGTFKTGSLKDIPDGYSVSKTFSNKVASFDVDAAGNSVSKQAPKKASSLYKVPQFTLQDGTKGSLNAFLGLGDNNDKSFGKVTGGKVIMKTPDGRQTLVTGSVQSIIKTFNKLKGKHPYVELISLDAGTYLPGLTKDENISAADLQAYDKLNTTGGSGFYEQNPSIYTATLSTPNIRTTESESYKKGHSVVNEAKKIILHHTAAFDEGRSADKIFSSKEGRGTSAHVVITRNGKIIKYADPDKVTYHAGESSYKNRENANDYSIGVEFDGDTNKLPLTPQQITSFENYFKDLRKQGYNLTADDLLTHEQVRDEYILNNPQFKEVQHKPDISQKEYDRIYNYMKKKKYAKGGFLGSEQGAQTMDGVGQGLSSVANMIVPGAGAAMNLMTGLDKFQMSMIDRMGPQAGDIALGTDAREAYDNRIDSGLANGLRSMSGIPGIGGMLGKVGATIDWSRRKKGGNISSVAGYATGGMMDQQLSSDATLIQGNPNVTDGNQYGNVALDHDEVVKDNFVFSNKLYDPRTGKSFAKEAERIAKSTGKAERRLSRNPHDILSSNTIRQNEMVNQQLANSQERLASALGLRKETGEPIQKMAYGGPTTDPALTYVRNPNKRASNYIWNQQLDSALNPFYTDLAGNQQPSNLMQRLSTSPQSTHIPQSYPSPFYAPPTTPQAELPTIALPADAPASFKAPTQPKRYSALQSSMRIPDKTEPRSTYNEQYPNAYKGWIPPSVENGMPTEQDLVELRRYPDDPPMVTEPLGPEYDNVPGEGMATDKVNDSIRQQFTIGDSLQMAEVLFKFKGLGQGPQKEPLYQDKTDISRNYYRPDSQLLDNSNSYNQAVRGVDTNSANTFNSLQANLLSSKFKADNQVRTNVNQMNRGAALDYEARTSNQTRYNLAQMLHRNDLNSRNAAAYDQAQQNAYTSVGNFGEALNRKKQGYDTLRTYKDMYPNVESHLQEYLGTEEGKSYLENMLKSFKRG